ncbi:MAG: adenylate/guanylate cyclase domain-containing protein [Bacteroidota bacterium]
MINDQTEHIQWDWQLTSQPKEIWPFITDTNRLFKELGQPSIQKAHITQSVDPGLMQLSYNGIKRYEVWEEEPYEWEYPYRFGVIRHYQSGVFKDVKIQVDLKENSYGTQININLWVTPRYRLLSFLAILKVKTVLKRKLKKIIQRFDDLAVSRRAPYQKNRKKRLVRGGHQRLQQIKEELYNSQVDGEILEKLISFICRADDLALQKISPLKMASQWQRSPKKVFAVFVHAAKANLLNFNWDLYCPQCRSVQESVKTLNQIYEPVYCDQCEKEFKVNFNKTIQLSFRPHPLIRKISDEQFCERGPWKQSHIVVQQYLKPGDKRYVMTDLPAGTYKLRASGSEGTATLHVGNKGNDTIHVNLSSTGLSGEEVSISNNPNVSLENNSGQHQLITLEQTEWKLNGVSAARATSSQLFRNLFADEVLRKGEKISVDNLTLMFTDLLDSTGMYNQEGDDKAVGRVIEHFEILHRAVAKENGAIVKTIGDSVMAVFCEPGQALRSYLRAQEMIANDDRFTDDFQLKAGIHHGSCVAVNLNSRIDYFGATVNIASRFVDVACEDEVIISQDIFRDHNLQKVLADFNNTGSIEDQKISIKGFAKQSFFIKRINVGDSPLRLAI